MGVSEFVGVDGCKAGWFSVGLDCHGGYEVQVHCRFLELLDYYRDAALVLVDIPIGLPEGRGGRDCDREARRVLGKRGSSVFPTPTRQTVHQAAASPEDYDSARTIEQRASGKSISTQAFAIASKIAEVDSVVRARSAGAIPQVREVHPEVCFWALNRGRAMQFSKKNPEGRAERLELLQRVEPQTDAVVKCSEQRWLRKEVARDDILDALVAAITSKKGSLGKGLAAFPIIPPRDPEGLLMEMVYCARGA